MNTITMSARDLAGLLTDLLCTAESDPMLPMLSAVHLHSPATDMLVGISSNRFHLGQALEACQGRLPECLISTADTRRVLSVVKSLCGRRTRQQDVQLTVTARQLRVDISHDDQAFGVRVPLVTQPYVDLRAVFAKAATTASVTEIYLSAELLAPILTVARRRGERIKVALGSGKTPVMIQAGPNYQALLMPMPAPLNPLPQIAWHTPPSELRRAS
ncbi:hypothetical protein D5S17_32905 [Pseudonocardiaceae bacterium YIM PH 21723]|nr:hypothetical protein D5S17_32905 [Pseudonocardiaceae bacterium YIM PH 21723]